MRRGTDPVTGAQERFFAALLRLFPGEFQDRFAGEMRMLFRDQRRDARNAGRLAYVRFLWKTGCGLIITAVREHREILFQDADFALRMMRNDLAFTTMVIAILGMAIGASTVAFLGANAILIQPLPFSGGNHLIHLEQRMPGAGIENVRFSVKEIEDYRSRNHTLDSVVEFHEMTFSLLGGKEPLRVDTGVVSANFLRILGVAPLYGRTFMDEDDRPDARPVLVLSYNFWKKSFGGDPDVVGEKFSMNDKEHVVVGILPPIPQFPAEVDVYMPTVACPTRSGEHALHDRSWHMMNVYATLKPGVSLTEVKADLNQIAKHLQTMYPNDYPPAKGYEIGIDPVHEELSRDIRPVLIVLAVAVGLLLLLACANVTGIMISKMLARTHELTIRTMLGAGRSRILRGMVTEGVMLAALGGLVGLFLAYLSMGLLVNFASRFTSLASQLAFTPGAIFFCFLLSLTCGTVIGFVPSIGMRYLPLFNIEASNPLPSSRISSNTRRGLVAVQLGFCVILLVGAGLALRTVLHLERVDAGFQPSGLLTARIYILGGAHEKYFQQLLERIRPLPGVESVGLASTIPLRDASDGPEPIEIRETNSGAHSDTKPSPPTVRIVTPGYFRTLGASILAGRDFNDKDSNQASPVVIVNQHLANRYWPDGSAVGKQIAFSTNKWLPIVGVVSDIRNLGLDQEPVDEVYGSNAESPQRAMGVVIRSSRISPELGEQIKWIAHDIDPNAVVTDVRPMIEVRKEWMSSRRTTAILLSLFAMIALFITASGISGMMALTVGERKHEIGIRLAMGATPGSVILSMMKQVLILIALGLGVGFCAAWLMSASMAHIMSGIVPRDAMTYTVSSALLTAVAMVSAFIPLIRIAKLDPVVLLRAE
ncbi:MAG TPA: ABC transporter permease [Terracidiphilus sp.]|jgi:putative ABC transport system permease protein